MVESAREARIDWLSTTEEAGTREQFMRDKHYGAVRTSSNEKSLWLQYVLAIRPVKSFPALVLDREAHAEGPRVFQVRGGGARDASRRRGPKTLDPHSVRTCTVWREVI